MCKQNTTCAFSESDAAGALGDVDAARAGSPEDDEVDAVLSRDAWWREYLRKESLCVVKVLVVRSSLLSLTIGTADQNKDVSVSANSRAVCALMPIEGFAARAQGWLLHP